MVLCFIVVDDLLVFGLVFGFILLVDLVLFGYGIAYWCCVVVGLFYCYCRLMACS